MPASYCKFTSSWLSDDIDVSDEDKLDLVDLGAKANRDILIKIVVFLLVTVTSIALIVKYCCCRHKRQKID